MSNQFCRLKTNAVKALIRSQDLKLWWVAEYSGIHKTTLRRWLSGRIASAQMTRVEKLATVLNTPLHEIIVG